MPIYRFYRLRWCDAWYELSDEDQQTLLGKVGEARDRVGGHSIVDCESSWATEAWHFFGIEEYPNVDCLREHRRALEELGWFQYVETESMLGTYLESRASPW